MAKSDSPFQIRQDRLRAAMETHGFSHLLVTNIVNIRYLTGFTGSAGVAVVGPREGVLWVDPRYTLQAREQANSVEVIEEKKGVLKAAAAWLGMNNVNDVGFEAGNLTVAQLDTVREHAGANLPLEPAGDLVEELRAVKDQAEIDAIRQAGKLTAEVFMDLMSEIRPGVTENDLAATVEYVMRKKGAEGAAFETIVASGSHSSFPHARPSAKPLEKNELVIFDMGAILGGYAADMTRTVFLGEPKLRVRNLYSAVLNAEARGIASVAHQTCAGEIDAAARRALAKRRLARFFTHSTGHGVGLEIHERPRLAKGEKAIISSGAVITVEPGIYIEGFGGIRIEDTVLVTQTGAEILTPAPKDHWIIS